jgi:hypothetical protein
MDRSAQSAVKAKPKVSLESRYLLSRTDQFLGCLKTLTQYISSIEILIISVDCHWAYRPPSHLHPALSTILALFKLTASKELHPLAQPLDGIMVS